ncbi:MAG: hypothetical protein IJ527_03445, partial [Prevotella sp.]|nr:hypothetical protein [Prevotella sp.]
QPNISANIFPQTLSRGHTERAISHRGIGICHTEITENTEKTVCFVSHYCLFSKWEVAVLESNK